MFNKKFKFKNGDLVSPLSDLTKKLYVASVFEGIWGIEKVVTLDDQVFSEFELTFYSKPISKLAQEISEKKVSEKKIEDFTQLVKSLHSKLDKHILESKAELKITKTKKK